VAASLSAFECALPDVDDCEPVAVLFFLLFFAVSSSTREGFLSSRHLMILIILFMILRFFTILRMFTILGEIRLATGIPRRVAVIMNEKGGLTPKKMSDLDWLRLVMNALLLLSEASHVVPPM